MRHRFAHPLAFGRSPVAARQVGTGTAFVDKDQILRGYPVQSGLETTACPLGVGPVAFDGRQCLFFGGSPKALSVRESTGTLVIRR